jgi:hypothetical protein
MEKENWIQNVLDSHIGMTKVSPNNDLFSKIEAKIYTEKVSTETVWLVAASITALIALNIGMLTNSQKQKQTSSELLLLTYTTSNQLY